MSARAEAVARRRRTVELGAELRLGLDSLRAHKLRALLTMLGMIFGVAAVVAMLSIGAGAQQEAIAFIEQLGVRNVIVEAREAGDPQTLQRVRRLSAGLSRRDLRLIEATLVDLDATSARKRIVPTRLIPRPQGDPPVVFGVSPVYAAIAGLRIADGRFFDESEAMAAAPVAVLGHAAASSLFSTEDPIGRFVKVNQQWFGVIGVVGPQITVQSGVAGLTQQDGNQVIYVPLMSAILRLEESRGSQRDEIDGVYLQVSPGADIAAAGALVRGLLDAAHRGAGDFRVILPAELLAEQQTDATDLRGGHGGDRRRYRHHEHHAGERARAHAGDWRPPSHRRPPARRLAPVPAGDDDDHPDRRGARHGLRSGVVTIGRLLRRLVDDRHGRLASRGRSRSAWRRRSRPSRGVKNTALRALEVVDDPTQSGDRRGVQHALGDGGA